MLVFGEDVGRKGGVYGLTRGLQAALRRATGVRHAARRAVDPRPRASASASAGCCRCPRSSTSPTCTTPRTSCAARRRACASSPTARSPTRWWCASPGSRYQKGFGGHFHNDDAVGGAARHPRPGRRGAVASRGRRRRCCAACLGGGGDRGPGERVPRADRALSRARSARAGDRGWLGAYYPGAATSRSGRRACTATGGDLTIVTFGNGVRMSLRVAQTPCRAGHRARRCSTCAGSARCRSRTSCATAAITGRVLVADETRHSGGVGEGVITALVEHGFPGRLARVASRDSFVPLGDAANLVLLGEADIRGRRRQALPLTRESGRC